MAEHNSDISLSDDDSDEEFLTVGEKQQDREALVRKKLLESFYGKSAVQAAAETAATTTPNTGADSDEDDDNDDREAHMKRKANSDNLDSPHFDAAQHTVTHVTNDSVQDLLELEEQLALQVRTLDSTMQTLVYENYTRFIDATDAIHSIGTNVQANEAGLAKLTTGIHAVDEKSRAMEEALGSLRDQVAEKIRIKRLLTRLDALLKLPQTLKERIAAGKYRTATKSYLQAASILGKHSEGFESLKNIETECTSILSEMKRDLYHKLLHWSGRRSEFADDDEDPGAARPTDIPHPPKSMTAIFECVGTLLMILLENGGESLGSAADELNDDSDLMSTVTVEDLQSMATSAALRLLDRALDAHAIEVQERRFAMEGPLDLQLAGVSGMEAPSTTPSGNRQPGSALIAQEFLSALLKGATLFSFTFGIEDETAKTNLMELVSEAFASFLVHTKNILLEESIQAGKQEEAVGVQDGTTDEADMLSGYAEVSGALLLLVHSVKEFANGLAMPDVGISSDYAMKLVHQVSELTESMIRRRVDQKFHDLRQAVIQDCLIPFVSRAESEKESSEFLAGTIQNANSTLSNCLQLVDDTIRSILAGDLAVEGADCSGSVPDLKSAVDASTKKFAFWLANSFEVLAGGEACDGNKIAEAAPDETKEDDIGLGETSGVLGDIYKDDRNADVSSRDDVALEKLDKALSSLTATEGVKTDFVLAVAEMCRIAQTSVSVNLEQSIATHVGGSKKNSRGLFASGASPGKRSGQEDDITCRFRLAESRVIVLFATYRGCEAAHSLCMNLSQLSDSSDEHVLGRPSDLAVQALGVAKKTALEIASVSGDCKRATPVSELNEDRFLAGSNHLLGRKTGLQLDVERMFKEKVSIYPHPSEFLESSRDAALYLLFKVAFRAMYEQARLLRFSPSAYRQLQVDSEFLKHMTAHYVSNGFHPGGTDARMALADLLTDVMDVVGDRCIEEDAAGMKENYIGDAVERVKSFLAEESDMKEVFVIGED